MKKYFRKAAKILLWTIGSIIVLFLLIVVLVQVPAVQNTIKDKAVTYLQNKIHTKVALDRIEIGLPKNVIIEGLYLEDQKKDTLVYGEKFKVDISLFKLLSNELEINSVDLTGITAHISRNANNEFNFDYIARAFASKDKKEDTSAPMKISVKDINLDRIRVKYNDAVSKNDLDLKLGHFDTRIKTFDLQKQQYDIPKITLRGLKGTFKQGIAEEVIAQAVDQAQDIANKPGLDLKLGTISLEDIDVGYISDAQKIALATKLSKLDLDIEKLDLAGQSININSIAMEKTGIAVRMMKGQPSKDAIPDSVSVKAKAGWKVKVGKTAFSDIAFRLDNENAVKTAKGIDYGHLDATGLNFDANDLAYAGTSFSGNIKKLTVKEKSGLDLQEFKSDIAYNEKGASLTGLSLKTPQTTIGDKIIIKYASLDQVKKNIGSLIVDADLKGSQVGFKDVLLFAPDLQKQDLFRKNPNAIVKVNSKVSGKVSDLLIPNLEISGIGSTKLAASGRVTGLPDAKKLYLDLKIRQFQTTYKDIAGFIPKGTIPANIHLPSTLSANGTFKGTFNNFNTDMALRSSSGNANVKAIFDSRVKNREKYDAHVVLDNFDVGNLIQNDSLGKISLKADVKGNGLNPKTAVATIKGNISKAEFNGYTYKNLNLKGKANGGTVALEADMKDPNLTFSLAGEGKFKDKYPAVKLQMNVDIADLEKLHLHAGPLKLRGIVDADFPVADIDNLNGTLRAYKVNIANGTEQFPLDSISVVAVSTAEQDSIIVKSQFVSAKVKGNYKLSQIGAAIQKSVSKYYNTGSSPARKPEDEQDMTFDVMVKNDPILMKILPDLKGLEPIKITGRYNSVNDSIVINGAIPKIIYGTNTISNAQLKVDTKDGALTYGLVIDEIQNASLRLPYTNINGTVKDNVATYNLQLKDVKDKDQYLVSGTLQSTDGSTLLKLDPKTLMLNYENWTIPADNEISFGPKGLYINNLKLENSGSVLSAQSQSKTANAPIDVTFSNFKIETLTNIIKKDDLQISGVINGKANLKNLNTTPVFTSDLNLENLMFRKEAIGNLSVKVDNETANTLRADITLSGNDNDVKISGNYRTDNGALDLLLDLNKMTMASVQAFSMGNLSESTGFLSGQFKVAGTIDQPKVNGELLFNDVAFRLKQLNSKFQGINEKITFNENGLQFDNFTIKDRDNNELVVDGNILTKTFREFGFDLAVNADKFRAVDSKEKDSDLYYGELILDADLKVKGDVGSPVVKGNIKIDKDTKFTVVLPQSDPSVEDREGIVEFIDRDNPPMIDRQIAIKDSLNKTQLRGIDASVNIEIDKDAELSMVIDKGNGDYLKLRGEARLTGGIDPSGKTTLTGRYEFTEGSYEMTFNLIKRKFDIREGSYILWTGEPTSADINIVAAYRTEAAPIDLLEAQLGNLTAEQRNTYKQKIPFDTELKMNGQLLKPEITFDITRPEGNNNVSADITDATDAKLAQLRQEPSELNKQVFALLLLNRFIGENPFASEAGGTDAESMARQSASKILSQQLNNIAGNLINGIELNFDLESTDDYTSGQKENRTDLNVGISKKLLNDRLKVTVGSSFGLEGPQQAGEETNNIAGDVSVDYQLTKDGRYMVRAYRKNDYQIALQGQIVETGVAFIITMDYKKFSELFHRSEEEKEMKEKRKLREKEEAEKKERLEEEIEKTKTDDGK